MTIYNHDKSKVPKEEIILALGELIESLKKHPEDKLRAVFFRMGMMNDDKYGSQSDIFH